MQEFPIINVEHDAEHDEPMGTKFKFWFSQSDKEWLFKQGRPTTGEDWAEKIASELADLLGVSHANYELAVWQDKPGVVSSNFLPRNGLLAHGNEILHRMLHDYPDGAGSNRQFYHVSQHTLEVVLNVIDIPTSIHLPWDWSPPLGITTAVDTFVGYLLLDAWIGNTDRHDQNWAVILNVTPHPLQDDTLHLAPTYDHASSLGRNVSDEDRQTRLTTADTGFSVQAYAEKAVSAFFETAQCSKPMTTFDTFRLAAQRYPEAANIWLDRLGTISQNDLAGLLGRIPPHRISPPAIDFALKILDINSARLLELKEELP